MPATLRVDGKPSLLYWLGVIAIMAAVVILRVLFGLSFHRYVDVMVTSISGLVIGLVLVPVILKK